MAAFLTPAAVAGPAFGGYLFFYFTGEGTATGEQVYLAARRGNDPLRWDDWDAAQRIGSKHVEHDGWYYRFTKDERSAGPDAPCGKFIDEFGGRGYVPFQTTDLASGRWQPVADCSLPVSPRHGTVLPVTAAEPASVRAAYR